MISARNTTIAFYICIILCVIYYTDADVSKQVVCATESCRVFAYSVPSQPATITLAVHIIPYCVLTEPLCLSHPPHSPSLGARANALDWRSLRFAADDYIVANICIYNICMHTYWLSVLATKIIEFILYDMFIKLQFIQIYPEVVTELSRQKDACARCLR